MLYLIIVHQLLLQTILWLLFICTVPVVPKGICRHCLSHRLQKSQNGSSVLAFPLFCVSMYIWLANAVK